MNKKHQLEFRTGKDYKEKKVDKLSVVIIHFKIVRLMQMI